MASVQELEETEAELVSYSSDRCPPAETLSKYLRLIRELKIRDSYPVARYGSLLLEHHKRSLGEEELWLVYEQVAIAALDAGALPFASSLIKAVATRFPESSRTKRLQGMYYEASGNMDKAVDIYTLGLADKPSDEMMSKRLVALEKTRGNLQVAAEALKKYVDTYSGDKEAWEELGELYVQLFMYKQALFCYEELLTFIPTHVQYLLRYADILYTLGGANNYRMARSYYAKAVEASAGRNARALFGILSCYASLTEKVSLQDARTRAQIELPDLATQALVKLFKQHAPDKLPLLQAVLQRKGQSEGLAEVD